MARAVTWCIVVGLAVSTARAGDGAGPVGSLGQQLTGESPDVLAKAARDQGDPVRGALLFYRPELMCSKCHVGEGPSSALGPDLSRPGAGISDAYLIESVLDASKTIKKGYETVTLSTKDGKTLTGLLAEARADVVILRDPKQDGRLIRVARAEIEERNDNGPSIMPNGLVNQLSTRQQFLDLARYVLEISEKGPTRALELRPDPALLAPAPLPAYESNIDHAGMITSLDGASYGRGEAIYNRVCANCHGTKDQPGSLPTSLRFASGTFRNGSDPFRMYQTITRGYGQMPPQTWMVPEQKYDVIHYIRQALLRNANPTQYVEVDRPYLAALPTGKTRGPAPVVIEPWVTMDYGPTLSLSVEVGDHGSNIAYKGIAVRLDDGPGGVSRGRGWVVYDHDTMRLAAAWHGDGFIDWNSINFNGRHEVHPRVVGKVIVENPDGPGWADPSTGGFSDPRVPGRDGRRYGPLPRGWVRYWGLYRYANRVIMAYQVGDATVLESPGIETNSGPEEPIFSRTLEVGSSKQDLWMRVAAGDVAVSLQGDKSCELVEQEGWRLLHWPASPATRVVRVLMTKGDQDRLVERSGAFAPPASLSPLTRGASKRWPEILKTKVVVGAENGPFAVDVLTTPETNPWLCQLRLSGVDFFADGQRAAVCSWDGDVWLVDGLRNSSGILSWQRIAAGLFQPLGVKIKDGQIFVSCRDQIVRLRDLNGDGETDFYECFNSDHQVTEHFHEFAMGLQTDAAGNFYYAKAARHGKTAVVPQHGTLLRVSPEGLRTDILATGFRAPNGVCLNKDGTFFLTDQEGFWMPKNRINWVKVGGFYGNMWGYHDITDPTDGAMEPPVCWITNAVDRSPAELLWVDSERWGPLNGSLLNLSYGYGKIYIVPHERVGSTMQGGVSPLPIPQFPTGVMRGRFHPKDGQLYVCGLYGWAGNQTHTGGFYRVRYTGKPVYVPISLNAMRNGVAITFSGPLDRSAATDPSNYSVKTWSLKRTVKYGSDHYDEKSSRITGVTLSEDRGTVTLQLEGLKPVWCMEIKYSIRAVDGTAVNGQIDNTIHRLPD
jgi:putative heme-binding domain-containing protein